MSMPEVSVVVPVYNSEKYLEQCLDSLLCQTFSNFEVVCVNDESSDRSLQILEEYAEKDHRISVRTIKNNVRGAGRARNTGLDVAKGEYVVFLDSDDYFEPNLLEGCVDLARKTDSDIVIYDARRVSDNNEINVGAPFVRYELIPGGIFSGRKIGDRIFQIVMGASWTLFLKKAFVDREHLRFQEDVYMADDIFFTYTSLACAERLTILKDRLLNYRENNVDGQSKHFYRDPTAEIRAFSLLRESLVHKGVFNCVRKSYYKEAAEQVIWHFKNLGEYNACREAYECLQKGGLESLGFLDASKEDIPDENIRDWIKRVTKQSYSEYLFDGSRLDTVSDVKQNLSYYASHVFPSQFFKKTDKVVLYGAGKVGIDFFIQNLMNHYCSIVSWADAGYASKGFPVISPERISAVEFDYILIAVINEGMANEIRTTLIKQGIAARKLIWAPYRIVA